MTDPSTDTNHSARGRPEDFNGEFVIPPELTEIVRDAYRINKPLPIADTSFWVNRRDDGALQLKKARQRTSQQASHSQAVDTDDWKVVYFGDYLRGKEPEIKPTVLQVAEQGGLLYPGRLHLISGEPESLKSWLTQIAVVEVIKAKGPVVYIDHEAYPQDIAHRLIALYGNTEDDIRRIQHYFHYIRPESPAINETREQLEEFVGRVHPHLLVIDGIGMAMGAMGLDANSQRDYLGWLFAHVKPLLRLTPGPTIMTDHVTKDAGKRTKYAAGTFQKQGQTDVHLGMSCEQTLAHGKEGRAVIKVHKDKLSWLHSVQTSDERVAVLVMKSDAESGSMSYSLLPAETKPTESFRYTGHMENISKFLEGRKDRTAESFNLINSSVKGARQQLQDALQTLIAEHYVISGKGPRGAITFRSTHDYRQAEDPKLTPGNGV